MSSRVVLPVLLDAKRKKLLEPGFPDVHKCLFDEEV
jgi:hypothetical protein